MGQAKCRKVVATMALAAGLAVVGHPGPAAGDGNGAPSAPIEYRSISDGLGSGCAILDDGSMRCWGSNSNGHLGLGDTANRGDNPGEMGDALPPVDLGTGRTVTAVSAGFFSSCALLDGGDVKCWGSNFFGGLGIGDNVNRGDNPGEMGDNLPVVDLGTGRTAIAVGVGNGHACALLDTHQVKCWGENAVGQLGLGDTVNRGDGPGEMGDNLPVVDLGTGRTALAISVGDDYTCAVLDDHTVKCWGEGDFGRLGSGSTNDLGDAAGEMGNALVPVNLGTGRTALAVSARSAHSCALLDNHQVKCWGLNSSGELGIGSSTTIGDGPGEMGDSLPIVPLGTGRTATSVTVGSNFSCAVLDDATAKCWGNAGNAQLGQGSNSALGNAPNELGDNLPPIQLGTGRSAIAIASGQLESCALLDDHSLKCWGFNQTGGLGRGDTTQIGDNPGEMGDALARVDLGTGRTVVPVNRVRVTVSADQSAVVAGQVIDYDVTVTNTGGLPLTQVQVHAPDEADCAASIGDLAPGASSTYPCSHTTTDDDVPLMTNQVLATSAQGAFDLSGTRRTRVDAVVHRPDGLIRLGAGAFAGNDVYSATGTGQARSAHVGNRGTATFTVRVQNDGNTTQTFTVKGLGPTTRFAVTYRNGSVNVTSGVVAGTFTTAPLAPGATQNVTLTIKAKAGTPIGTTLNRLTTFTSTADASRKDAVKATVTRR
jgi:alpha-tubulin suppressor-like RCC1 family protein